MATLLIASWFAAGTVAAVFSYGMTLAYFNAQFPWADNRVIAWVMAVGTVLGWLVVIQVYFMSHRAKHGLKFA